MIRRLLLALVAAPLLAHGGEGVWMALRSQAQEEIACDAYATARTSSAWVRITGCEVDYLRAGYREKPPDLWRRLFDGEEPAPRVAEVLFPVRAPSAGPDSPALFVAATRDPQVLALVEPLVRATPSDQEQFLVTMLQVVTALRASRQVEGLRRPPLDRLLARRSALAVQGPVRDDPDIIDLHDRPRPLRPALELLAGSAALLAALLPRRRRARVAAGEPLPPLPRPTLPRLMLVNLPPTAPPADLEEAPALGPRTEVLATLAAVLDGLRFQEGSGRADGDGWAIGVDLGPHDPVHTVVVELHGAAKEPLSRLLTATGWRAYAPRLGAFVTPAEIFPPAG